MAVARPASWDVELGYRLYLEGKTCQQIADACGTKLCNVKAARRSRWKTAPDGGRNAGGRFADPVSADGAQDGQGEMKREEVTEVDETKKPPETAFDAAQERKMDTARMMEVIARMTSGMGGIKAVCVGNIIQALWNLSSVDDIREARNILNWLEENYDFG